MLYRVAWLIGLAVLIILCLIALWEVSFDTCGRQIPILLSRALTTDPYRGLTLAFCLIAVASSLYLNSVLLIAGFFGFFSAFLVSMFQTNAHNALIVVSSLFVLYECYPKAGRIAWAVHWWLTAIVGVGCSVWLVYSVYGCDPIAYSGGPPLPPSVDCSRCSWWYITEYLFFWSTYALVYWVIPDTLVWRDKIPIVKPSLETPSSVKAPLDNPTSSMIRF